MFPDDFDYVNCSFIPSDLMSHIIKYEEDDEFLFSDSDEYERNAFDEFDKLYCLSVSPVV